MENNYYTPSLNEFRIGFEYQVIVMGIWVTTSHDGYVDSIEGHKNEYGEFYDSIEEYIKAGIVRVKYLDMTDIENCGFKTEITSSMCYAQFGDKDLYVDYNFLTHKCKIHNIDEVLFFGKINNKSEFKQILKMIGAE